MAYANARTVRWALAPLSLLLAGAGCESTPEEVEQICAPGQNVFCRCANGVAATQPCDDSGMGFGECGPCASGSSSSGSTESSTSGSPDSGRPILSPCEEASECATTMCTSGYCTSPCYKPSDCPYPKAECVTGDSSATCVPACASDADCAGFAGTCQPGHAIDGWVVKTCR